MSKEGKNIPLPLENVTLSKEEREAIDQAGAIVTDRMALLGTAYLGYSDAEQRYMKAKADLTMARARALEADLDHGNVVAAISHALNLPPGEWTYDQKQGTLTKKEP